MVFSLSKRVLVILLLCLFTTSSILSVISENTKDLNKQSYTIDLIQDADGYSKNVLDTGNVFYLA